MANIFFNFLEGKKKDKLKEILHDALTGVEAYTYTDTLVDKFVKEVGGDRPLRPGREKLIF